MTKQKNKNIETLDLDTLKDMVNKQEQAQLQQAENAIAEVERLYDVSIGLRIDLQRLNQIISFMITNRQESITLKYEVWK